MRRSTLAGLVAAVLVALSRPAIAQDASASHRDAVRRLMAVTHVRELLDQSTERTLKAQLQQMPQLSPVAGVLREFYQEQLSWSALEPEYTRLYLEVFTESDVREMIGFYESPLGQRMLGKMPLLMEKTNELTSRRMQAAMPQLMERLQTAMQKSNASPADSARAKNP